MVLRSICSTECYKSTARTNRQIQCSQLVEMEHLATVKLDTMFANFPLELESCSSFGSIEDAQVEPLSGAVKPADRKPCSSSCQQLPTEALRPPAVPRVAWEDDSTEKRTQGRKLFAGLRRAWKSIKGSFQTQEETQVCAFVPEDPSQELPHTSGVDPTGTDPRESEPTDQKRTQGRKFFAGLRRRKCKSKKESIQTQEETQVCAFVPEDPSQELPHTSGVDPTGTDPRESEPTDQKRTQWRKFFAGLRRAWKSIKGSFQTQEETQVCAFVPEDPSQELPHTSRVDPTGTDPRESEPTDRSFESLYYVAKKLKSRRGVSNHIGFRYSDYKLVFIKFIKKNRSEKLVELPGYYNPLSQEAAAMLMVQKPPTSKHLVQLYDHFVMEDQDILIMEYPRSYINLFEYYMRNKHGLKEFEVKHIIRQLIVALHHCMSRGVYRRTHMKNILVHTLTLHVKLMDFGDALLVEERRDDEPVLISAIRKYAEWAETDFICKLLDLLVPRIRHWIWMTPHVSKECKDLLERLHDVKSRMTLQAMLKHDWFRLV